MRVATYYRYSSDQDAQKENSEARQKDTCLNFIFDRDWDFVREFSDKAVSGDDTKPSLEVLKRLVKTELDIDGLVVDDASRLTRKGQLDFHEDVNWLRDSGIKLVIARTGQVLDLSDAETVLLLGFDVYKNNRYLKDLGISVASGMLARFKRGKMGPMGPTPLGFDRIKRHKDEGPSYLVANDDLKLVTEIFQRVLNGATIRSCVDILEKAERFQEKLAKGESGPKDPSAQSVKHLLRNAIYCGYQTIGVRAVGKHAVISKLRGRDRYNVNPFDYAEHVIEVDIPKAVSFEDFLKVQKILDSNKVKHKRRPATAGHRYSSLLTCGNCGGHLVASPYDPAKQKKKGKPVLSYVCAASAQRGNKCREEVFTDEEKKVPFRKQVREAELDQLLKRMFAEFVSQPEVHEKFVSSLVKDLKEREMMGAKDGSKQLEQIALKEMKGKQLMQLFMGSEGDEADELLKQLNKIKDEIASEKKAIAEKIAGKTSMLDYAEKQFKLGQVGTSPQKYLGVCYMLARDVVEGKLDWSDEQQREAAKQKAVEGFFTDESSAYGLMTFAEVENDQLEPNETEFDPSSMEVHVGLSDPDEILENLRQMGLTRLEIDWEVGTFRGKPKHNVSGITLAFFDGNITHIGRDLRPRSA